MQLYFFSALRIGKWKIRSKSMSEPWKTYYSGKRWRISISCDSGSRIKFQILGQGSICRHRQQSTQQRIRSWSRYGWNSRRFGTYWRISIVSWRPNFKTQRFCHRKNSSVSSKAIYRFFLSKTMNGLHPQHFNKLGFQISNGGSKLFYDNILS